MGVAWRSCIGALCAACAVVGLTLPLGAQSAGSRTSSASLSGSARPAAVAGRVASSAAPAVGKRNPLLPLSVAIENFYVDLSLSPKEAPPMLPAGFESLLRATDWETYRTRFGAEADGVARLRSSGRNAFAARLIEAAAPGPERSAFSPALQRYLLVRAAAIAYRSGDGFPTADKAVTDYLYLMDKHSAAQVGALWSMANAISRTSMTPKADRIRYDGIAARANMQLALLMLEADQINSAQAITKQIAYHEGWLKDDPATRAQIARVRTEVRQAAAMMDYLATQYEPAIHNDVPALTAIYLYGRYVKGSAALVADLPGRVPGSPLAVMARSLDAAARGDVASAFTAAEALRVAAANMPDACIRARALYAAMQLYDIYLASPESERDRVNRTLARIAREAVVADGARKRGSIDPFASPMPTATAPARSARVMDVRVAAL
jgi:hypothetical protein